MRDDLLDAIASLDWAAAQMQLVQQAFLAWQRTNPYDVVSESDSDAGLNFAVAVRREPFPRYIAAGIGAAINSCRCSLDILAATLAVRNGKKPSPDTHFPIRKLEPDFLALMNKIESERWLSEADIQKIKDLRPYKGGNDAIWPMHALDIFRKHERLLVISGEIQGFQMLGYMRPDANGYSIVKRLEDKTVLCEMPPEHVRAITQGNSLFVVDVLLNERAIGLDDEPARAAVSRFMRRAREVVQMFD